MAVQTENETTETDYFAVWKSVWETDLLAIKRFILEKRPKRLTRYEIDEIIDPGGVRREKHCGLFMAYVPDIHGEYHSDDMYCFLITARVLDEHSSTCVNTPKWIFKHHKKRRAKFSALTESWEINYHSDFLQFDAIETKQSQEIRIKELENEVADLKQRLEQIEKVLFVEVTEVKHGTGIRTPWKRA